MNASLELRHLTLRVSDLARSVDFYTRQLGFVVDRQTATATDLVTAAGVDSILRLEADANAAAAGPAAAGLFHAALLFPNRSALGAWLQRAAQHGVEFDGFSDHAVSEAIYFSDPDGNGLEFYADRPRAAWPTDGHEVAMVTRPLDLRDLVAAAGPPGPHPLAGARWGHLHLRVTNLDRSERFYIDQLGLAVTQRNYPGARFLAADGYHHHLGLNVWGQPREPRSAAALGLVEATFARRISVPTCDLTDPDGIRIRVEAMRD